MNDNTKMEAFADKPKYAVSMAERRKHQVPASPAMVSDKVNKLIEWLKTKKMD